ncbi:MAG: site-specific integrase [Sulfuricurvum sp.]|nr:site-specific integrase [Sulfuricurvum sp.]
MIRRVYENQHGIITLDSDMFGNRKRISTGQKSDKRLVKWYEKHFDEEYEKLYDGKFKTVKESFSNFTLREYGNMVLDLTSDSRRGYVQTTVKRVFKRTCDFEIMNGKKFGELLISDIKSTHIMKWQKECGLASQTIATNRAYLNIVLQTAMNDDLIRKNPVSLVRLPRRVAVKEKTFFSEDEIKQIIGSAKGQLKNYLQVACFTGMRGSELIGLKWDDIDFEKEIVRVDTRIVGGVEDETKSRKIRYIPMFKQTKEALQRQRVFSGLREYVFIKSKGDHYSTPDSIRETYQKLLMDNKIRHGTIHDLRRSFNTMLKQHGYPEDWILEIMGHMDNDVNRNHYTGKLTVDMSKIGDIAL